MVVCHVICRVLLEAGVDESDCDVCQMGAGLKVGGPRPGAISSDDKTSFTGINKIKFGKSEWSINKLLLVTIQSLVRESLTLVPLKYNITQCIISLTQGSCLKPPLA